MTFCDINPPHYFVLSIIFVIDFHFFVPVTRLLVCPWNLFGLLLLAAGVYLNLVAYQLLKKYHFKVKPMEKSNQPVTIGVFLIYRNPRKKSAAQLEGTMVDLSK